MRVMCVALYECMSIDLYYSLAGAAEDLVRALVILITATRRKAYALMEFFWVAGKGVSGGAQSSSIVSEVSRSKASMRLSKTDGHSYLV
jgi:hypothetical protein